MKLTKTRGKALRLFTPGSPQAQFVDALIDKLETRLNSDPEATLRAIDTLIKAKPETRFQRLERLVETEWMYRDLCK